VLKQDPTNGHTLPLHEMYDTGFSRTLPGPGKQREGIDMPFIDSKITVKITDQQKEEIKTELGKLITTLNKSETYLMVGIEDSYDLWLGGKKLDKGAYVAVSLYGNAPKEAYDKLTGQICELLSRKLSIPGNAVYVTYHPVSDWGWNGQNF